MCFDTHCRKHIASLAVNMAVMLSPLSLSHRRRRVVFSSAINASVVVKW